MLFGLFYRRSDCRVIVLVPAPPGMFVVVSREQTLPLTVRHEYTGWEEEGVRERVRKAKNVKHNFGLITIISTRANELSSHL